MNDISPRVRFAPSPTGDLHVGNARTALFNWLFARRYGGRLVLRIEDTDRLRTSRVFEENILADLAWLGIDWDEGPGRGGPYGPYHQSERLSLYRECLERLIAAGMVYPCFCTDEELEAERLSLLSQKLAPRYLGKCLGLDEEERRRLEASGRPAAWRFHVPPGLIAFHDLIRGDMRFAGETLGDFIIVRSNGIPAYNFAVVVDDHHMGITHVIRGEDHLSNTALQLLLYRALGFAPPRFAHHALILGRDRAKLGKRHGATAVREFREQGVLPEALVNYLALLGSSFEAGREFCRREETVASFSLDRAGKSGAVFDEDKLRWLNSLYIRQEAPEILARRMEPFVAAAGYGKIGVSRLHGIIEAVRDNINDLTEIGDYLRIFDDEAYDLSPEARAIIAGPEAREVIASLLALLAEPLADDRGDPEDREDKGGRGDKVDPGGPDGPVAWEDGGGRGGRGDRGEPSDRGEGKATGDRAALGDPEAKEDKGGRGDGDGLGGRGDKVDPGGPVGPVAREDGGDGGEPGDLEASARKSDGPAFTAGSRGGDGLAGADDEMTPSHYRAIIERLAERTGRRGKRLFLPLRAALTGRVKGPELDRCFAVLGRASLRRRLEKALTA
ncbi:MAG: glutamate--tRNA ligase [Pseudomonadota bacterium]|nr:glutamate--tRNA ligase [Pseudomonadota bacterium]